MIPPNAMTMQEAIDSFNHVHLSNGADRLLHFLFIGEIKAFYRGPNYKSVLPAMFSDGVQLYRFVQAGAFVWRDDIERILLEHLLSEYARAVLTQGAANLRAALAGIRKPFNGPELTGAMDNAAEIAKAWPASPGETSPIELTSGATVETRIAEIISASPNRRSMSNGAIYEAIKREFPSLSRSAFDRARFSISKNFPAWTKSGRPKKGGNP